MAIIKESQLGTIAVSDRVYSQYMVMAIKKPELSGRAWLSNGKGKILYDAEKGYNLSDIANNIVIRKEDGRCRLECYIVTSFGSSIKRLTGALAQNLFSLTEKHTQRIDTIVIHLTGVKAKLLARRDLTYVYERN